MSTTRTDPKATLSWSLNIECPLCHQDNDLSNMDDDGVVSTPIFNNKWDDLVGETVECRYCGTEFKIGKLEY